MPSKAEQICARMALILSNMTNAMERVYRDRQDAFAREEPAAIIVECIDEETQTLGGGNGPFRPIAITESNTLQVAVTVAVRMANWQQEADTIRTQAHQAIVNDGELLLMTSGIRRERCEWRSASADLPFGYAAQIYSFRYTSRAHALDAA